MKTEMLIIASKSFYVSDYDGISNLNVFKHLKNDVFLWGCCLFNRVVFILSVHWLLGMTSQTLG